MYLEYKENQLQSYLRLTDSVDLITANQKLAKGLNHIFWNRSDRMVTIRVDGLPSELPPHHITTATELQVVTFESGYEDLLVISFNRQFYCLKERQEEVSCNGVIFYGTREIPLIALDSSEQLKMNSLFKVLVEEFNAKETAQGEMLEMLLARFIIKCTRLAKDQLNLKEELGGSADIVRAYTLLVDRYFKTSKHVADYAEMLNKSPKTLSNLFSKISDKTPLRIIHERIVAEAERMLLKTDLTAKEIAFELGFEDASAFNKTFKKINGASPMEFKGGKVSSY